MENQIIKAAIIPSPIEAFLPPTSLNGETGSNRAPDTVIKQIEANNDLQAIQTWLLEFEHSPQTQRTYRKEGERLLLWSILEKGKPFSSLSRDDLRDYQSFLKNPQPQHRWCGPRRPRHLSSWRPFERALTDDSTAHAITIINALFNYLVEAGYLAGNPLGLMRRQLMKRRSQKNKVTERFLEKNCWDTVLKYIKSLPQKKPREQKHYERIRYLFSLLYLLGPRVSEVANSTMNDIKQIRGKWWWEVTGKGEKTDRIPVNDSFLKALMRYREFYQLSKLPQSKENHGLFMKIDGTGTVSANMIYRLVKKTFLDCAAEIEKEHPIYSAKLRKASTHWMRHYVEFLIMLSKSLLCLNNSIFAISTPHN